MNASLRGIRLEMMLVGVIWIMAFADLLCLNLDVGVVFVRFVRIMWICYGLR